MEKSTLIAITVFVVVSLAVFVTGSLLDQRSARARLLRERLASVQKAAERQPSEELALLRDEMLSEMPALDSLLRRSALISSLHIAFPGGFEYPRRQRPDSLCAQREPDMDSRRNPSRSVCTGGGD